MIFLKTITSLDSYPLYFQHSPKAARRVVRLSAIVVDEYPTIAKVAEKRPAELAHLGGCHQPTRRFGIEGTSGL